MTISCLSAPPTNPKGTAWRKPPQGVLKLNFDGAFKGNPGSAGFGFVIWDHNGDICKVCCGPLEECNSTKAKTMGMLMGIRELKRMKVTRAIIEATQQWLSVGAKGRNASRSSFGVWCTRSLRYPWRLNVLSSIFQGSKILWRPPC